MHGQILDKLIDDYAAIIFQSFGVGGLPDGGEGEMAHSVGRWISAGKTILMMTQVPYEGSDMEIYQVGQQVKKRYPMAGDLQYDNGSRCNKADVDLGSNCAGTRNFTFVLSACSA